MQNKNLCTKIGLLGLLLVCVCLPMKTFGIQVEFKKADELDLKKFDDAKLKDNQQRYNHIHFVDNGNDFGGILFITAEGTAGGNSNVQVGGEEYACNVQYRGVYYNSERGERLWPLDENTRQKFFENELENFGGGLYYECRSERFNENCEIEDGADDYYECFDRIDHPGIYGMVSYKYKDQDFSLIAGVEYTGGNHWFKIDENSELSPTFDVFSDERLLGFVYDTNGGLGFVGCEFTGNDKTKSLRNLVDEVMERNQELKVESPNNIDSIYSDLFVVGEENGYPEFNGSNDVSVDCKNIGVGSNKNLKLLVEGLVGVGVNSDYSNLKKAGKGEKMQFFSTVELDNSVLINYAKKKAELLCRGKWNNSDGDAVVCRNGGIVYATNYPNKTLIVKNGDVIVTPNGGSNDYVYDIFVDKGMLYIDDGGDNNQLFDVNGAVINGNISDFNSVATGDDYTGANGVAVGKLLKGNFIVNGLIGTTENNSIPSKYFIHGKFTSLNTIDNPLPKYREYLAGSVGKSDHLNDLLISFGELFTWTCEASEGTDGNACPEIGDYWMAPLVVIERSFPSALLK